MKRNIYWGSLVAILGIAALMHPAKSREERLMVMVEGYHHLQKGQLVSEYRVNYDVGGSVDFDGRGGDINCCFYLPAKWKQSLRVDVRWIVWDWSKASEEDIKSNNRQRANLEGIYRAIVPVELYREAEALEIHFFSGGRVRVIARGTQSPAGLDDHRALAKATQGARVSELYTKAELEREDRRTAEFRKRNGDWR